MTIQHILADNRTRAKARQQCRCFSLLAILHATPAQSLDEVIVTATRNPIAVMDYPGSATRIGAAAIGLTGPTHSAELLNRAPGTLIQRGSGQESLTSLRSPVLTGAGACGAVLVLEDSIPIRPVGSCNVNELFEINAEQAAAVEHGEQITAGNDIDTAPREVHALRLRRDAKSLAAELEWLHVGRYWTNAANTARYDGHDLVNLRLSWQPHEAWTIALRLTNLLDTDYADRADFAFGNHRYFPGRGRAAFVELGWRED